ncbi:putative NRPS-like protein biosynthetic cluster [Knufia obscura]|uniref:NRPS-like protein biosynthetic cluster n=2 Tax=Knufia TaxID=430999 RepID=A0AAN8ETT2_9EURO|nr:putative NRPS-like protein biosynthetic cluster [Knufia obscura]KAK5953551.1 putative NRPS-like protein biosynthetic cluster [Knufia fluminis]
MAKVTTNYFVCTLGEAAQHGISRPYSSVSDLIKKQSKKNPDLPAIGFYVGSESSKDTALETKVLTFHDVYKGTASAASLLSDTLDTQPGKAIGLLADSSPAFLFTWLGCISLGHPVLLLAPQLAASAVAHLCKSCEVTVLLTDKKHEDLGAEAAKQNKDSGDAGLRSTLMPFTSDQGVFSLTEQDLDQETPEPAITDDSIAYLHHTSGTSSGLPKPIPQTHHGAIGVLPALDGRQQATFTTTPLYHGGPADIFRAWTSNAMIWLFPSKDMPITASNIRRCLEAAEGSVTRNRTPPVKYFTSVPYVLQMMAADEEGLKWLQKMDLVGVGGAALPAKVGDELVEQGVNVVSRFGSAECGFLLSSHREYAQDREWQYLRQAEGSTQLQFEAREEGLHELVIKPDWPHMAKRNRDDGSYATADLFEKHAMIANAWKYHSRADSQLTLITGKKFDPASIEHDIVAASDLVADVLLFGNGKPYPGVLLFRSQEAQNMSDEDMLKEIAPVVEKINEGNQKHTRIPRNMLVMMPFEEQPLEKSSKGTIIRNKAEAKYESIIEQAYNKATPTSADVADEDVSKAIHDLTTSIVGNDNINVDDDLFSQGVDSVACVQIRHGLSQLLPKDAKALPLTVVEDSGTISELSKTVLSLRHGGTNDKTDEKALIPELVKQYSQLDSNRPVETMIDGITTVIEPPGKTVLLTGATGSLGSHVLGQLLQNKAIQHIYVLVRGATPQAARERVHKALSSRKLSIPDDSDAKVTILQCKLSDPDLGLAFQDYSTLQSNVDIVLHMAWTVNFLISLRSFAPHFAGIQNLLNLCLSSTQRKPPRFVFCSSVASVSNYPALQKDVRNVPEDLQTDLSVSGSTGYARSKLTAELILANAATNVPSLRDQITAVRVGQLSADTNHGIWSASEAYPQILATAKMTDGMLPDLGIEERLTWLPVDVAAKAFVETSLMAPEIIGDMPTEHVKHMIGQKPKAKFPLLDKGTGLGGDEIDTAAVKVVHLLNPDQSSTFTDFLTRLQQVSNNDSNEALKIVPAQQWLEKLEALASGSEQSSEAQKSLRLLPFWKQAYSNRQPSPRSNDTDTDSTAPGGLAFDVHNSLIAMPALAHWLGLSTIEGRRSRGKAPQVNGDAGDNTVQANVAESEDTNDDVDNELLRKDYISKIWNWVRENVP